MKFLYTCDSQLNRKSPTPGHEAKLRYSFADSLKHSTKLESSGWEQKLSAEQGALVQSLQAGIALALSPHPTWKVFGALHSLFLVLLAMTLLVFQFPVVSQDQSPF